MTDVVLIKKMREDAILPTQGSQWAAGYDLYNASPSAIRIPPHTTQLIDTGIAMAIPHHFVGYVFARSGIATKRGLRPANCVGVIDEDYRGSIGVALHNDTDEIQVVAGNERIAQIVIQYCPPVIMQETDTLDETERGAGGFGSTGTN